MTSERDLARDKAHDVPNHADLDVAPGRATKSAHLRAPDAPVVSGILMRKANGGTTVDPERAVAAASGGSGESLPDSLRSKFESSLGTDLSSVRVHTSSASAHANKAVGANAYAIGNDIHFGTGQYDPSSSRGQHLIAHEVAHTVQQRGASPTRQNQLAISTPGDAFELEADRAAAAMVSGSRATVSYLGGGILQRDPRNEEIVFEDDEVQENVSGQMREDAENAVVQARKVNPALRTDGGSVFADIKQADVYMGRIDAATGPIGQLQGRETQLNNEPMTTRERNEYTNLCSGADALSVNEATKAQLREFKQSAERQDIKHSMFAPAYQSLQEEFLRLRATVDVIKAQNVKVVGEGAASDVEAAKKENPELGVAILGLKTAISAMKEYASNSAAGVGAIATAVGNTFDQMNTAMEQMNLPLPKLEDTEKQAEANAQVAKVNADLESARSTIGTIKSFVETAVAASTPAGTLAAAIPDVGTIIENAKKGATKLAEDVGAPGVANVAGDGAAKAHAAIEGQIEGWLTNYTRRISAAQGGADAIKKAFDIEVKQISADAVRNLATELKTKIKEFYDHRIGLEKKKAAVTEAAKQVEEEAKKQGKTGTDIGATAQALASVSSFLTQAYEAETLGNQEMADGDAAADKRQDVAGNYNVDKNSGGLEGANKSLATTNPDGARHYYECEVAADANDRGDDLSGYELKRYTIQFTVNSDDVNQRSVVMKDRTHAKLNQITLWTTEARAFEMELNTTLGTGPSKLR
jgi:hypothetical protein